MCEECTRLLHEALNLATRSNQIEAQARREATLSVSSDPERWEAGGRFDQHVQDHNEAWPHKPISTRSATMHVWMLDQYDKDLAEWEATARRHLLGECPNNTPSPAGQAGWRG